MGPRRTGRSINPLSYLKPKNWAAGATLVLGATVAAGRDVFAPRPAGPSADTLALAVPVPAPALAPPTCRALAPSPGPSPLASRRNLGPSGPAPGIDLADPFAVATAAQSANLMGSTAGACVFRANAQGTPGVAASDVHQDILHEGDCQTLSVLASVAHALPNLITSNLAFLGRASDGSNRYAVKLYVNGQWNSLEVTDADLPGRGALQKTDVLWPRLYEAALIKAFPQSDFLNKYVVDSSQPPSGRVPASAATILFAVTGGPLRIGEGSATDEMLTAAQAGKPGSASDSAGDLSTFGRYQTVDAQSGDVVSAGAPGSVTLLGAHQYAVLGATGQAPQRQVTLFNPYNYPGSGGSTFTVSEAVFDKFFSSNLAWMRGD